MTQEAFLDLVQSSALIVMAAVLMYVVHRLEKAFDRAGEQMRQGLAGQRETLDSLNRIWGRIIEIENRQGIRNDLVPAKDLRAALASMVARLDQLEKEKDDRFGGGADRR